MAELGEMLGAGPQSSRCKGKLYTTHVKPVAFRPHASFISPMLAFEFDLPAHQNNTLRYHWLPCLALAEKVPALRWSLLGNILCKLLGFNFFTRSFEWQALPTFVSPQRKQSTLLNKALYSTWTLLSCIHSWLSVLCSNIGELPLLKGSGTPPPTSSILFAHGNA